MSGNDEKVNLLISALVDGLENVASLTGELKKLEDTGKKPVSDNTKDLREGADQTTGSMESLRANIGKVVAIGASLGVLAKFMKSSSEAAMEAETRMLTLEQGIKATGRESEITGEELRTMAQELALGTLASTEEVEKGAAALMTFRNVGTESFGQVLELSQDLAQMGFGTLESNAKSLGKALEDPVKGMSQLSRQGVTFSEEQEEVIKSMVASGRAAEAQALILANVTSQVGGVGRAAAEGTAGALDTLQQRWQELKEAQGDSINPAIESFYLALADVLVILTENLDKIESAAKAAGLVLLALGSQKIIMGIAGVATQLTATAASAGAATGAVTALNRVMNAAPWLLVAATVAKAGGALWDWKEAASEAAAAAERADASEAKLQQRFERLSDETGVAITSLESYNKAKRDGIIIMDEATGKWTAAAKIQERLSLETRKAAAEQERQTEWADAHAVASSEQAVAIAAVGTATRDWSDALTAVDLTAKDADKQIATLLATADMGDSTQMAGLLRALDEINQTTPELAAKIEKELIGTIQKLDAQSLATLQASLKKAFDSGTISAEQFAEQSGTIVEAAAKRIGLDLATSLGQLTPATENALRDILTVTDGMKIMGKTTAEQSKVASDSLNLAFSGAKTKADIDAINAQIKAFGQQSLLSASQITELGAQYETAMQRIGVSTALAGTSAEESLAAMQRITQEIRALNGVTDGTTSSTEAMAESTAVAGENLDKAGEAAKSCAINFDRGAHAAHRLGKGMDDAAKYNKIYADATRRALDSMSNSVRSTEDFFDALRRSEIEGKNAVDTMRNLDRQMRRLEESQSDAARGTADLELRLLEINGTEEEIATARLLRDKAEIKLQIEKNKIEAQRAISGGDLERAEEIRKESAELQKQIKLLDEIATAEARQNAEREKERAEKSASRETETTRTTEPRVETVKTVTINFGGESFRVIAGDEDNLIRAIEQARLTAS